MPITIYEHCEKLLKSLHVSGDFNGATNIYIYIVNPNELYTILIRYMYTIAYTLCTENINKLQWDRTVSINLNTNERETKSKANKYKYQIYNIDNNFVYHNIKIGKTSFEKNIEKKKIILFSTQFIRLLMLFIQ